MERGVNIVTNNQTVILDGAEELVKRFEDGKITREQLYEEMLQLDTVYIDRSKSSEFKDPKDTSNSRE